MAKLFDIISPELKLETTYQPGSAFLFSELYKDQVVVVKFLRRFGCCLCRHEALELSKQARELEKLNVKLIAVGFDRKGVHDFMHENFWRGELYLDTKKELYNYFGFEKYGVFKSMKKLMKRSTREAIKKSNKETPGNFKGDGFQMGGTVILDKSGKLIYIYKQTEFEEYPGIEEILRVCNYNNNYNSKDINSEPRPLPLCKESYDPLDNNETIQLKSRSTRSSNSLNSFISSPSFYELPEDYQIQSNLHTFNNDEKSKYHYDLPGHINTSISN